MLTSHQIDQCEKVLLERQAKLIPKVHNYYEGMKQTTDAVGELSSYDNHPGDLGTELFERGKDLSLIEHAEKELNQINQALHAIEEGTYGLCVKCGGDIPFERMLALPTTATCMEHAEDETSRSYPIEEEIIYAQLNPDERTVEDEKENMYDREDAWQEVSRYGSSDTPSDLYEDHESYRKMYPNSDEDVGTVEDVEGISYADLHGKESD